MMMELSLSLGTEPDALPEMEFLNSCYIIFRVIYITIYIYSYIIFYFKFRGF